MVTASRVKLGPIGHSKTRPPQPNYRPGPAWLRLAAKAQKPKIRPGRESDSQSGVFELTLSAGS